jgi:hypothetical protein
MFIMRSFVLPHHVFMEVKLLSKFSLNLRSVKIIYNSLYTKIVTLLREIFVRQWTDRSQNALVTGFAGTWICQP